MNYAEICIIKRDGKREDFSISKIKNAISKAFNATGIQDEQQLVADITMNVISQFATPTITVEEIQDLVEKALMKVRPEVAKKYIIYREWRNTERDKKTQMKHVMDGIVAIDKNDVNLSNANMSSHTPAGQMMTFASEVTKDYTYKYLLPKRFAEAHQLGDIHIHDLDFLSLTIGLSKNHFAFTIGLCTNALGCRCALAAFFTRHALAFGFHTAIHGLGNFRREINALQTHIHNIDADVLYASLQPLLDFVHGLFTFAGRDFVDRSAVDGLIEHIAQKSRHTVLGSAFITNERHPVLARIGNTPAHKTVDKQVLLFARLDQIGVGKLVKMAAHDGRETRPDLGLGICGEHGGDPSSVEFCHNVGLDYVSCSPFRVPIARLAAAQAAIKNPRK